MPKKPKTILETDHTDLLDVQERYLHATDYMRCDGCGEEKAISKGVTYLEHIAHRKDGKTKHTMVFCPRCILAIKYRQSSVGGSFEVHPMDLVFDKLPNRFQSAWMRLRQRFTKDIHNGVDKDKAWSSACNKLIDELGMRHLYERDLMVSKQAEKFQKIIADIDKENAKLGRRLKAVKKELLACADDIAKRRLELKLAVADAIASCKDEAPTAQMANLAGSISRMREVINKI